jgi:hypothetical protein
MGMTPAQLATFKAAILADPNLAAARAAGDHGAIATYYNANGTGFVWRPSVPVSEVNTAIVWSEFAVLSALLQTTYMAMIQGGLDATSANMRGGFTTVFGPATASRANLTALAQRTPTRFEALFTASNVSTVFGYVVTAADVAEALGLP